jgi:outer membrane protein assembly factor BamB
VEPEVFLKLTPTTKAGVAPVFEDGKVYIFQGGVGGKAQEESSDGYQQSDIRLGCYDLDGNPIWETTPDSVGWTGIGVALLQFYEEDYLFIGCSDGLILFNKTNGEIIYEKSHDPLDMQFDSYYTFDGEYVYTTAYTHFRCFHVPTGDLIWQDDKNYSRDCKPIIYKNHVYVVDSDALRYYNKKTGKLLGENHDLGLPGYGYQRYMPWKDDILYILRTEEIVAVRME